MKELNLGKAKAAATGMAKTTENEDVVPHFKLDEGDCDKVPRVYFTLSLTDYGPASFKNFAGSNSNHIHASQSIPKFFQLSAPTNPPYYIKFISARPIQTDLPLTPRRADGSSHKLAFHTHHPDENDQIIIPVHLAGSFQYCILLENSDEVCCSAPYYIIIDPVLSASRNGSAIQLSLNSLCCLTIIPKWMPLLHKWEPFLEYISRSGYNMIHFVPLNQRGISNSPYAIKDQLSISSDLFDQPDMSESAKEHILSRMLLYARERGVVSVTDVVWNHTSCDSPWLLEHPEAGYNLKTAPHLRPAFELDELIVQFSGSLSSYDLDCTVTDDQHLHSIMQVFKSQILPTLKLWEFYVINVAQLTERFEMSELSSTSNFPHGIKNMSLYERAALLRPFIQVGARLGHRFAKSIPREVLSDYICALRREEDSLALSNPKDVLVQVLDEINLRFYQECDGDLAAIVENVTNRARFLRLALHGPHLGSISHENPLVDPCFTRLDPLKMVGRHTDELCLANNGWIWNADPLVNFASADSKAYLRREVIVWGDCVKLRYENCPADNPWLWKHIEKYTCKMARLFQGFRIDNCHSTPIHVAEHFLKVARQINPNLYVFAELFTGSQEKDIIFVSKLGIHSLIREAMNAWDSAELSRLSQRMGGNPIGSFLETAENMLAKSTYGREANSVIEIPIKSGYVPHCLFMDCTHDNETPNQKRTAADTLANAAVVAFSFCAVGSVQGYDELVPELLNIVTETRKYKVPEVTDGIIKARHVLNSLHESMAAHGYHEIHVHQENDFIIIHRCHPITHDGYLLISRSAFKSSVGPGNLSPVKLSKQSIKPICGATLCIDKTGGVDTLCETSTSSENVFQHAHIAQDIRERVKSRISISNFYDLVDFPLSPRIPPTLFHVMPSNTSLSSVDSGAAAEQLITPHIQGLASKLKLSAAHAESLASIVYSNMEGPGSGDKESIITISSDAFFPGSIAIYRTRPSSDLNSIPNPSHLIQVNGMADSGDSSTVNELWSELLPLNSGWIMSKLSQLSSLDGWFSSDRLTPALPPSLDLALTDLGIPDFNVILFKSDREEQDSVGTGVYDIPYYGPLVYAGLQGFVSMLSDVAKNNDLGHPFCQNIRAGLWMVDYVVDRLTRYINLGNNALTPFHAWLSKVLSIVRRLPCSFVPKYFTIVISVAYQAVISKASKRMVKLFSQVSQYNQRHQRDSHTFLDGLAFRCALTAFQLFGKVKSAGLCPPNFPPMIDFYQGEKSLPDLQSSVSLAAGLPHFSTSFMRCWGRDIFISLRGLALLPGHFGVVRSHLIAFGATLKHGLIPNLLDQGIKPRYNARDAVWWWLYCVGQYVSASPEGHAFLSVRVPRRFVPMKRYQDPCLLDRAWAPGDDFGGDQYCDVTHQNAYRCYSTIGDLCQEILERHYCGISFTEWNAGPALDHAMSQEGFRIDIHTDWRTGLIFGGNRFNCGTWMDKMGDSWKAGTRGVPATPRDGAAIEIIGLLRNSLNWIQAVPKDVWKYRGVWKGSSLVTYESWAKLLDDNFEAQFHYFPPAERLDSCRSKLGIYKDTVGSSFPQCDLQLRPNICVAMVVAPELFDPNHARAVLKLIRSELLGPLGMKTLDPSDPSYRGFYHNNDDSEDGSVAHGFNYHQGPEWLWLTGFFMRAYIHFYLRISDANSSEKSEALSFIHGILRRLAACLQCNAYSGLPELTNKDGAPCHGSCPTQAWSSAVVVETIADLISQNAGESRVI